MRSSSKKAVAVPEAVVTTTTVYTHPDTGLVSGRRLGTRAVLHGTLMAWTARADRRGAEWIQVKE